jgi:hypothetical protein
MEGKRNSRKQSFQPQTITRTKFDTVRNNSDRPRAIPKAKTPLRQTTKVKGLAEEKISSPANNEVEAHILTRIRKCPDRANHPTTPAMEVKAALHMSSRLVSITNTKNPFAKAISQTRVHIVAEAMEIFFDCKSYSSAENFFHRLDVLRDCSKYRGAATAFEIAHNLTLEWAGERNALPIAAVWAWETDYGKWPEGTKSRRYGRQKGENKRFCLKGSSRNN